jgi:spore coat polysaccharide biosynthesis predicted glycosyltransferase SpsG
MRFLFFVECGSSIGLGHIKRSLLVAKELSHFGAEVSFAPDSLDQAGIKLVRSAGFALENPENSKITGNASVVIDGYNFEVQEIKAFHPNSKIIVFEDYCHREFLADIVVDANYSLGGSSLRNCEIESQAWLAGKEYVIVDEKYASVISKKSRPQHPGRILVSLGSGDVDSLSIKILNCLKRSQMGGYRIDLLPGPYFPRENLEIISRDYSAVIGKRLYEQYDFAIGAAGTSSYERLAAGIFSLNIIGNANQKRVSLALAKQGLALSFDALNSFSCSEFSEKFSLLTKKGSFHPTLAEVPDGRGQLRIASELLRLTAS